MKITKKTCTIYDFLIQTNSTNVFGVFNKTSMTKQ